MKHTYLFILKFISKLGFEKSTTRLARWMANNCKTDHSAHNAGWDFCLQQVKFGYCMLEQGCYLPVTRDDDPFHEGCRQAQAKHEAEIAEEEAAWGWYHAYQESEEGIAEREAAEQAAEDAFWASICKEPGCYDEHVQDGYCQQHWDYNNLCFGCGRLFNECDCCHDCGKRPSECKCYGTSISSDDFDDPRDDECEGGCGQPNYACTCAELESLRRHNADPATRGSYWTA